MKKFINTLLALIISYSVKAQFDFTAIGLYTSPLDKFCVANYSDGWGAKFGLGYTQMGLNQTGVEFGFNWLVNNNGTRKAELPLGDYTLSNNWYNWQFKLNGVVENGVFRHYAGLNIGRARYYTNEYLDFTSTQEDGMSFWNETLYKTRVFQYGAQIGTYIKLNDVVSFDLGASIVKSDQSVKYINFESYTYDGELIDYQEPISNPFLVTISAGIRINLSNIEISDCYNKFNNYDYDDEYYYDNSTTSPGSCGSSSSSSSASSSSSSSSSSKGSSTPKLFKNGKTPVKYK